jgi:hypothetical protein
MPSSDQVMSWAKISRRQLDNWVNKGYIKPVRAPGQGWGGMQYDWSMAEAKVAQRMGALTEAGIAPAMAAKFARGERKPLEKVLHALACCVTELRWSLHSADESDTGKSG